MSYTNTVFLSNTSYSTDGSTNFDHYTKKEINGIDIDKFLEKDEKEKNLFYKKLININFTFKKALVINKKYLGSGDVIDFITHITGIKKLIIWITKGKCGCEARRKKFNSVLTFVYFTMSLKSFSYQDEFALSMKIASKQKQNIDESQHVPQIQEQHIQAYMEKTKIVNNIPPRTSSKGCGCSSRKN
jgi:hypothetical protein